MPSFDRILTLRFRGGVAVDWPLATVADGLPVVARPAGTFTMRRGRSDFGVEVQFQLASGGPILPAERTIRARPVVGFLVQLGTVQGTITALQLGNPQVRPATLSVAFAEPLAADVRVRNDGRLKLFSGSNLSQDAWARLVESSASENVVEQDGEPTIVQQEFATFEIRARNDLDVFDALSDERGRTWDITAIEDIPFDRTAMRINCQRDVGA